LSDGADVVAAYAAKLARFDEEIEGAFASSAAGEGVEVHEAFDEMRRYLDTLLKKKAA
jgi:hypothetical protein